MVDTVVARTDGVPLFAEELTKAAVEAGTKAANDIPMTLADSLMARLDRLGAAAKETAQVGAVLGREFEYALLRAVHQKPEASLEAVPREARRRGIWCMCAECPPTQRTGSSMR